MPTGFAKLPSKFCLIALTIATSFVEFVDQAQANVVPTVNVESVTVNEGEFGELFTTRLFLSEATAETCSVTVNLVEGSATYPDDFVQPHQGPPSVTFAPGEVEQSVSFRIIGDGQQEPTEQFELALTHPINCTGGTNGIVTILDDDLPAYGPIVNVSSITVSESARIGRVFVTLSEPVTQSCGLLLKPKSGEATNLEDFRGSGLLINLRPGVLRYEYVFQLIQDNLQEGNETFTLVPSGLGACGTRGSDGVVTIVDDDGPGTDPTVSVTSTVVSEGKTSKATVDVLLTSPPTNLLRLTVTAVGDTASPGDDFFESSRTLTFGPTDKLSQQVSFDIVNDQIAENIERFSVVVTEADNAIIGNSGQIVVLDDDDPTQTSLMYIESYPIDVFDSTPAARVDFHLDRPSPTACTAAIRTSSDGIERGFRAVPSEDYTSVNREIGIPAGETKGSIEVPILQNDGGPNGIKKFQVVLERVAGGCRLGGSYALVTIFDDLSTAVPIIISNETVEEGTDQDVSISLTLPRPRSTDFKLDVVTKQASAISGADYLGGIKSVVFAAGETTKTVSYAISDFADIEPVEFFWVDVVSPEFDDADRRQINFGVVTIKDDDYRGDGDNPRPNVNIGSATVTEGDDAVATIEVTLSQPSEIAVSAEIATSPGTAVPRQDYVAATRTVTFEAYETLKKVSFSIVDDAIAEADESFDVRVVRAFNANIGTGGNVLIRDNDSAGVPPTVNIGDNTVTEGEDRFASVVVALSRRSDREISVEVASRQRSAISGPDYLGRNYLVKFAPGETTKTVRWGIVDDTDAEPAETFVVVPVRISGAIEGRIGTVTINDNDGGGDGRRVDIGDTVVTEGSDDQGTVTLTLSRASASPVVVEVASRQRTAISGPDYFGRNYTITFAPGETQKTVSWLIVDDTEIESDETFAVVAVRISGAVDGRIGLVTIRDNDGGSAEPRLDIGDASVVEGVNATADVRLTLSRASNRPVTVEVASRQRTAISGPDYFGRNYVVTYAPGETTKTVRWAIVDDNIDEPNETFAVVPVRIEGAIEGRTGTVTISDR